MTEKRKVLGRGLETLLPPRHLPHASTAVSSTAPSDRPGEALHQISLDHLDRNPYQTRTVSLDPAALNELAASIQAVGVLQPIVVRPVAGGRYQVIAGERRCEAARMLHHQTIPAVVRPVSNEQAMEMTIVENLQRLDLTPMEEARGYERLSRARVVALAVIVYQPTPRTRDFGELPLYYLAKLNASYYADAAHCDLCKEGAPVQKVWV